MDDRTETVMKQYTNTKSQNMITIGSNIIHSANCPMCVGNTVHQILPN